MFVIAHTALLGKLKLMLIVKYLTSNLDTIIVRLSKTQ